MLIKDYLEQYKSNDSGALLRNHIKLHRMLNKLAQQPTNLGVICKYILKYTVGDFLTPESIQDTCDRLFGVKTIERLFEIVDTLNWVNFDNIIFPVIEKPAELPQITANELCNIIKKSDFDVSESCDFVLVDRKYDLITDVILKEILEKCPYNKLHYEKRVFDCDDISFTTKAWVYLHFSGGVSFGYTHGIFFDENNKILFAHAFNLCITDKKELWLIEPQEDMIIRSRDDIKEWFGMAKTLKLTFVYV